MSFNPHIQGGIVWNYWHLYAANAVTEEKRANFVAWVNSQKIIFFCETCRIHLIANLEQLPVEPYMKSNISLFYHSWKLHDMVNAQLNKPVEQRLTYPQAFEKYFGRPPPTVEEETRKQSQPAPSRVEAGTQRVDNDGNQRFMTRAGHSTASSTSTGRPTPCASCAKIQVENGPKIDYDQFRKSRRKVYEAKN